MGINFMFQNSEEISSHNIVGKWKNVANRNMLYFIYIDDILSVIQYTKLR
jgi:hypothetical protein